METSAYRPKKVIYFVGFAAALAGLLFGVDIGTITGALIFIRQEFPISEGMQGLVVSAVLIGAVLGTLVSGWLCRHRGRRYSLLVSGLIFSVGGVLSATSTSVEMLIGVRIFLGIGLGIAAFTAPLYLSEVAPKSIRGALISLYQFMITFGILAAFISDTLLAPLASWRWMLGITSIPAVMMYLCVLALPRSPRWLMLQGRKAEAIAVLNKVRHSYEVEAEAKEIEDSVKHASNAWQAFKLRGFGKLLLLGVFLQVFQQFSGINAVLYYAPRIFQMAGFQTNIEQMWCTVLIGLVNCLTTIVAIFIVDRLGRRPVLFFGTTLIIISLMVLGMCFHLGIDTAFSQKIAVLSILSFIVGFAVSLGPVIWILCAEIFPLQGRDIGMTFATLANWSCNALIAGTFPIILTKLDTAAAFWIFAGVGVVALWFFASFAPETKQVSLERIEANLLKGRKLRELGSHDAG